MKNIIIGTAGHIDHGKTSLIRALTGRNTDRLKEEQARGITIDLGFTWFDLPDGTRAGIIDVPGHEKFINNMVSGVVGMDLVMMVVAADEGIMPQTREHLNILELLGIKKTILVINKCDLVEEDWLELVKEDLKEELKDTIMENAPVVCVSSIVGTGIEELKTVIMNMIKGELEPKNINTIARLPVDRVFTIAGFGTVVTGTLISGSIKKDEVLELFPGDIECKVRNLQVHSKDATECFAGQRVAINIAGVRKEDVKRGYVLAPKDSIKVSSLTDVKIDILKDSNRTLRNRDRLHLYTGTSEVLCRAVILDKEEIKAGESGLCQLILEEEIAIKRGDRFVVRFYSPLETIGGGIILEANPLKKKRFNIKDIDELKRKLEGSLSDVCELNIKNFSNTMIAKQELAKLMAVSIEDVNECLKELNEEKLIEIFELKKDSFLWHRESESLARQKILTELTKLHQKYPYRQGVKKANLQSLVLSKMKTNLFEAYLDLLIKEEVIKIEGDFVSEFNFKIEKDETYTAIEKLLDKTFTKARYELIRFSELEKEKYSEELISDVLRCMQNEGKVVAITDEMFTLNSLVDEAKLMVCNHFKEKEIITISEFRDMLNTSRKSAKPILEYFDSIKITKKVGAETERVAY